MEDFSNISNNAERSCRNWHEKPQLGSCQLINLSLFFVFFLMICHLLLNPNGYMALFTDEIRKSAGNAGIKTFTSKLDQGLMADAVTRG